MTEHHKDKTSTSTVVDILEKGLGSLRTKDAALQDEILDLFIQLAEVKSGIAEAEGLLLLERTPISRIPQEVLELVFLATVPKEDAWLDVFKMPSISHVCRSWRTISIQLPALWSRFTYRIDRPPPSQSFLTMTGLDVRHFRRQIHTDTQEREHLNLWFRRSNPLPVSFCVKAPDFLSSGNVNWRANLHAVLSEQKDRIEVLRIDAADMTIMSTIGEVRLTSLKRLELALESCYVHHWTDIEPSPAFNDLPSITSIQYSLRSSNPFLFPVKWRNLTDVDIGDCPTGMSGAVFKYFLRCCTHLERGRFFIGIASLIAEPTDTNIPAEVRAVVRVEDRYILPGLQALTLIFEAGTPLHSLLHNLELPRLDSLVIYSLTSPTVYTLASWRDAFVGLSTMRTLTITCDIIGDLDLLKQCFEQLPALEHLKIKMQHDAKLFQILNPEPNDSAPAILPRLQRLTAWIWPMTMKEKTAFWTMVHMRRRYAEKEELRRPFTVDALVDKNKMYAEEAGGLIDAQISAFQDMFPSVAIQVVSPYASM